MDDYNYLLTLAYLTVVGYAGGWLFHADGNLLRHRGIIIATVVVIFVFLAQLITFQQLVVLQNWSHTAVYSLAFIYRLFKYAY